MDLRTISQTTTWGDAASDMNLNFETISDVIKSGNTEYTLAKGLFKTLEDLETAYPYPEEGFWAYVGTSFPAYSYTWNGTTWTKSDTTGQPEKVDLNGFVQSEFVEDVTKILLY